MGSAGSRHLNAETRRAPGAAVHSTGLHRVRRLFSGREPRAYSKGHDVVTRLVSKDPTQCTWLTASPGMCGCPPAPAGIQMRPQAPGTPRPLRLPEAQVRSCGPGRKTERICGRGAGLRLGEEEAGVGWRGVQGCHSRGGPRKHEAAPLQELGC